MPDESPSKRKIDSEESSSVQLKRTKSIAHDDLRQSIVKEITKKFEDRIVKLETRISKLEEEFSNEKEKEQQQLQQQQEKETEKKNTVNIDTKQQERRILNKEPPPLPKRQATFGSSSFSFSPGKITPLNSFNDATTVPSSPKPVFGATTSFGNMNTSSASSTPEPAKSTTTTSATLAKPTTSTPATFGSTFGANTRFSNAFQDSIKKKSFLDKEDDKQSSTDNNNKDSNNNNNPSIPQEFKQVDLAPVEQTTGEEDEISHFNCTAKIFELNLSKINEGWKERGVGPLHLDQSKADKRQIRLVMRSQGLLRVVLNYKITADTEILKGLEASLTPGKFLRLNSVNSEGTPIQYLLKFGSESLRNELVDKIDALKEQIKE
ncbi:Ran-binding protein, putative [Candida dubliniensis CD36]|uniref:Ran-specific GTPase-activating protein, putative n=1 Tax=Candida dubliniensis (strain CD36 / ATCC MYA-646 / CBS 7987 / NCPF 3949 / NRRL Y-17841) TaxID=573826 RepID=B9WBK8_CANDC|nr:Ran-binding protein, putative [Candida dubliniensis CD36]CAX43779.1 Ran-binding protein, putative [Candida dubliniensis CD36]